MTDRSQARKEDLLIAACVAVGMAKTTTSLPRNGFYRLNGKLNKKIATQLQRVLRHAAALQDALTTTETKP